MSEYLTETPHDDVRELSALAEQISHEYEVQPRNHEAHERVIEAIGDLSLHPVMAQHEGVVEYVDKSPNPTSPEQYTRPQVKEYFGLSDTVREGIDQLMTLPAPQDGEWVKPPDMLSKVTSAYSELKKKISWDDITPGEASRVIEDLYSLEEKVKTYTSTKNQPFWSLGVEPWDVVRTMSPSKLEELYRHKEGEETDQSMIQKLIEKGDINRDQAMRVFRAIYRNSGGMDTLEKGQDPFFDAFCEEYSITPYQVASEAYQSKPKNNSPEELMNHRTEMRDRTERILGSQLGLSESTIERFFYASGSRLMTRDPDKKKGAKYIDGNKVRNQIDRIKQAVEGSSPEIVEFLADNAGVVNIDRYTADDLLVLRDIFANDEHSTDTLEHLRSGEVTVVFVDAFGDHNGAFDDISEQFKDGTNRTILFEVGQASDFYRRMLMLRELAIKPSNLVVSAHGMPGSTGFGKYGTRGSFDLLSSEKMSKNKRPTEVFLDEAALDRLVGDEFMQDGEDGTRKIIMDSCSSAVGKFRIDSVADAIAQRIGREEVRVYGADAVTVPKGSMSEDGVTFYEYNGKRVTKKNVTTEISTDSSRLSPDEKLRIRRQKIKSIQLNEKEAA